MKLKEIIDVLDQISPFELQEKWDNSGLQVGNLNQEIEAIYVSIDIDSDLLANLPQKSLLITHHPLLFSSLKRVEYNAYPAKLLVELIRKDIALISMHTNYDKTHLGSYVAKEVLKVEPECREFVCYFDRELHFQEARKWVEESFGLSYPKVVFAKEEIKRVALTTGSGGSLLDMIEADLFLTGDIKYHDAVKAKELGINMIDIGHFESERYFSESIAQELKNYSIKAIIASIENPFKGSE